MYESNYEQELMQSYIYSLHCTRTTPSIFLNMSNTAVQTVHHTELLDGRLGTVILLTLCCLPITVSQLYSLLCCLQIPQQASLYTEKHPVWQLYHKIYGNSPVAEARPFVLTPEELIWVPLLSTMVQCRNASYISIANWLPASVFQLLTVCRALTC